MREYTVFFEIFGKKLKNTLYAYSESDAKQRIAKKILFHKIELVDKNSCDVVDFLTGFSKKQR